MGDTGVRLLGDVAVLRGGEVRTTASRRLRTLLALLAVRVGEPVEADVLIDETWGEDLPQHPRSALQVAITRLRRWLGDGTLVTVTSGLYRLGLDPAMVDLSRFLTTVEVALRGDDLAVHEEAAALWDGRPLVGVDSPRLDAVRIHVEERRRTLTARHAALLLEAGRPERVVDLLADSDRLDEELAVLLVRALRDAGRPRDAVDTYLQVRRRFHEELGVEPGEELRALYTALSRRRPHHRPVVRPLLGREDLLARYLGNAGGVVLLEGPAGVGKSAVLREAVARAHQRGARTASSAFTAAGAPAAVWLEIAADLGVRLPDVRTLGPRLHQGFARLAQDGPLVITLDDAQHGDSASLDVLRVLARRGLPPGVVILVSARVPDAVEHPVWRAAAADLARLDVVTSDRLGPLPAEAVADLVRSRLEHLAVDDDLVAAVQARTGGHALHLTALLEVLAQTRTPEDARRAVTTVPAQVLALIGHQVDRLPDATRSALEALAVLAPCSLAALGRVLDRRPLQVADDLDAAARAGLVVGEADRFVLRHDLDADALRERVPPVRAAHLHLARLDTATVDETRDVFTVLRHTEGAAAVVEPERVAGARVDAGVESYRRRALPEALALLDTAEAAPADRVPTLAVHRALCLEALGPGRTDTRVPDDELDAALEVALAAEDDELAVLVAIGDEPLGLAIDGDQRRAARLRRLVDRPLRPRLRLDLLVAYIFEGGANRTVPELVVEAHDLAQTVVAEDPTALARVRALEARAAGDSNLPASDRLALAADAHRLAFATDDPALQVDALALLMSAELAHGHAEQTHKRRADLEQAAVRWFRPRSIWTAAATEAAVLLAEGDPEADAIAHRAAARGAELGLPAATLAIGAHVLVGKVLAGRVGEVEALATGASARSANTAAWTAAAALAAVQAGHDDQARAHLTEFLRRTRNPAMWFKRAANALAAGAAFGIGDTEVATEVLTVLAGDPDAAVLVGFGAAVLGPETLWTGLAAWTLGDRARAHDDLTEAVAFAECVGWTPWATSARGFLTALDDPSLPLPWGVRRA